MFPSAPTTCKEGHALIGAHGLLQRALQLVGLFPSPVLAFCPLRCRFAPDGLLCVLSTSLVNLKLVLHDTIAGSSARGSWPITVNAIKRHSNNSRCTSPIVLHEMSCMWLCNNSCRCEHVRIVLDAAATDWQLMKWGGRCISLSVRYTRAGST